MKKKIVLSIGLIVMMLLTGCSKGIELTEEESNQFAEYISKVVLKRDTHYDQGLQDYDYYTNTIYGEEDEPVDSLVFKGHIEKPVEKENNKNDKIVEENNKQDKKPEKTFSSVSLDEIFQSSVKVSYNSYKVYDSYPDNKDSYFVIESKEGYKLVVVKFDLKNIDSKNQTFDLLSNSINYTLIDDAKVTYQPLMTLLTNDMQFIKTIIPAQKTEQGVLVFRVESSKVKRIQSLDITCGNNKTSVKLK